MYLRRSAAIKYFLAAILGSALYCEWFIYVLQPYFWNKLECKHSDSTCIKVLFIADPQLQGDLAVVPPLNYLFNWDSDQYLKSTFSVVLEHFKPDVLVYLGDLMDEGSVSTMPQFHKYVKRLLNIFDIGYPVVQVWIPGDNDIGGERENVKKEKVEEFEKVFVQPSVITFKNISFYKVNLITHNFPKRINNDSDVRFVVSHYPVTRSHLFASQVNNEIHPNIYFCAHEHESKYVKQNKDLTQREIHRIRYSDDVIAIDFNDDYLYEIYVPTCSYRMGTNEIGYGAAVLENNHQILRYTVFWSTRRFPYLFYYLGVLIIVVLYILTYCVTRLFLTSRSLKIPTDRLPLLDRI